MATIYCFTSTGNSLYAAKRIAEEIGGTVKPMNTAETMCEDDVMGFVFPVYFWGLPRMMEGFVSRLRITNRNAYAFAVATYGGMEFGALGRLQRMLRAKGVRHQYGASLVSVANYIPEYELKDDETRRRSVDEGIPGIVDAIRARRTNRLRAHPLLHGIAARMFPDEDSDRFFAIAPACTGCGTCKRVCPAGNIEMEARRPAFQHRCEHCLACLHQCPIEAIDWKGRTRGRRRYRNANIALDELIAFQGEGNG